MNAPRILVQNHDLSVKLLNNKPFPSLKEISIHYRQPRVY